MCVFVFVRVCVCARVWLPRNAAAKDVAFMIVCASDVLTTTSSLTHGPNTL